ncbi:MAG: DUF1795 domain-containing protein [Ruminococcaceae bacterium]|nr:DUF1795 domain-containing protein [Oscillospiraceae bacterium]
MKKIFVKVTLTLLVLLMVCAAVSCKRDDPTPDGMQNVSAANSDAFYHLYVPENWISQTSAGISGARVSNTDTSNVTVTMYFPDVEMTPAEYWENRCAPSYGKVLSELEVIAESCIDTKLGGLDARQYVFKGLLDGVSYQFLQIIVVKGNVLYTLTYTATAENYDKHLETVESIRSNFTFA